MKKIQKDDKVIVISGKFKKTVATVEQVNWTEDTVVLKGVNVVKKAVKWQWFVEKTLPIHISNVMHYSEELKKPVRVSIKTVKGKKVRVLKDGTELK